MVYEQDVHIHIVRISGSCTDSMYYQIFLKRYIKFEIETPKKSITDYKISASQVLTHPHTSVNLTLSVGNIDMWVAPNVY